MYRNDVHIGDVFEYPIYGGLDLTLRVKIVGAVKPLTDTSSYWYQGMESLLNTFQISKAAFEKTLLANKKYRCIMQAGTTHLIYQK